MAYESMVLSIVFVPLLGAFILASIGKLLPRVRNFLSLIFVLSSFLLSFSLIPLVISGKTLIISKPLVLGINFVFIADGLVVFLAFRITKMMYGKDKSLENTQK